MAMTNNAAAEQYRQLDIQTIVDTASPHRLIQLMMERALTQIGVARRHIERGEVAEKGSRIGAAIEIVNGLKACLNHKAEERLAGNFDALYEYMMRRLLEANLASDVEILDEVSSLLRELKEAWDAIADQVAGPVADAEPGAGTRAAG